MNKRHEMLLFRYSSALGRGDFDAIAAVLREAEHDPALEAMIVEMNEAYAAEQTERFNHTNYKEIPMLVPIYENRTTSRSQSLLLIAAITVVAVMSVIVMMQVRGNSVFNTGQPNTNAMNAQINPLCKAITRMSVNVLSLPSTTNGGVVGTIPQGAAVQVLVQSYFMDAQGNVQMLWYFIAGDAAQGWASPGSLDTSECPSNSVVLATPTPFVGGLMPPITEPVLLQPTVVGLATSTPFPFNLQDVTTLPTEIPFLSEAGALQPTIVPPDGWIPTEVPMIGAAQANAETPNFPIYIVEEGDTLLSILQKFGFDASALHDFSSVNQLPENAVLTPGQALLIPLNMPDLVATCTVVAEQGLMVWLEPTSGRTTAVTTLPAGARFEVTGETEMPNEAWLSISAQIGSVKISGAWVRLAEMNLVTDCQTDYVQTGEAAAVEVLATFTPQPTPTIDPLAVAGTTLDGSGCTIETQNVVDVQNEASSTSPIREQLPAGTPLAIIAITQQADGEWYMVTYRSRTGAGMWWGYISTAMLEVPDNCEYWGSQLIPDALLMATVSLVPNSTATPVPLSTTTLLPSFTPTPAS